MMTLLDRYILKEHLWPFFLAFSVVMFILIIDLLLQMLDMIIGKGVPVIVVGELFFFNLAWMVALAVPMTVLVAVLMAYGQLAAEREVTAIKAGGISLYRMTAPVMVVSLLIAGGLIIFNDTLLPEANHRARNLIVNLRQKKPSLLLYERVGRVIDDLDGYLLLFNGIDQRNDELEDIVLYQRSDAGFPILMTARRATVAMDRMAEQITLTLYDGELHRIDHTDPTKYLRTQFQRHIVRMSDPGRNLTRTASSHRGDREITIGQMREEIANLMKEIREHRAKVAALTASLKDTSDSTRSRQILIDIQSEESFIENRHKGVQRYLVEIHKKFAIPVACPVFVLIGIPLAIRTRRGGMTIGFGIGLGFFLVYWMFLMGGEQLADRGFVEPWLAMWGANILIGGIGLYLFLRSV
ncbi:MAG: LptF/LptG family permease [Candidatus Latescibacteria bacterium]|nr:LptF/LptG family permease [Candidatus Latescibacterota bacterium]